MHVSVKLNSARMLVLAMLAALVPGAAQATPVDPAIMARFEQRSLSPERLARLESQRLIARGQRLFISETFNGNGRTCATCHPPSNNFTIDPAFIATLPDDDPLFVAEFNPDLAALEDPELMRRFGLILENLDGFDRPGVFRGVPHTLGLRVSMTVNPAGEENLTRADGTTVVNATGWSGDGAPGDGSLRSFTIGAIFQHFPRTLNRVPGEDFRLPTEAELDALEAFQLSLGRQTELDLATMDFRTAASRTGKDLFNGIGTNRACSFCHSNAGANDADGFNRNFATNAASLADTPARRFDPAIPGDGGFDSGPEFELPGIAVGFFGNTTMNTASLVEAADTGPFFHNNSAETIEDAVRFYTTAAFDPEDPFQLDEIQVNQVAAFLRTLNALENIRSSNVYSLQARRQRTSFAGQTTALAVAETTDAIEVLSGGPLELYPDAVGLLSAALELELAARALLEPHLRNALLRRAEALNNEARALLILE